MKKYLSILSLAIMALGFTSCLKDGRVNLAPGASPAVVEFSTNLLVAPSSDVNSPVGVYTKSYDIKTAVTLDITVGYTGGQPAPQDITVAIDTAANKTNAYNSYSGNHYVNLPANAFQLPSSVVIKQGTNFGKFTITFNTTLFDLTKSYVLPLRINTASGATVSGNYGKILIAVGAKNKYDGVYVATGTMVDAANAALTGLYPATYYVNTVTANSNVLFDPNYFGSNIHLISNGGAVSGYGSFSPVFTFDDAGNITSVVNSYGQPAANGRSAKLDPTGINKFTGTPGTAGSYFDVKFQMLQPGATVRTQFTERFTYQGPRP